MNLKIARKIISATLEEAARLMLQPLAVAVLDSGGHLVAFERQDGAANMRFQIAHGKAHGALALGVGSRELMRRAQTEPYFISAAAGAVGGALIPAPGGVLVRNESMVVGAIGVSGDSSTNDERAAVVAVEVAGLYADSG